MLLLFINFWFTYGVLWFLSFSFHRLSHNVLLLLSAAFMLLVVIVGSRQNWEDLDPVSKQVRLAEDMEITLTPWSRYGVSYSTNAVTAQAFEVRTIATFANYVLCGSVKLVLGALGRLRQTRRLRSKDIAGCSRVIWWLWVAGKRQSFAEIVAAVPGINPVRVFEDLQTVDGVLFLTGEPPGLTLHPELKTELDSLAHRDG